MGYFGRLQIRPVAKLSVSRSIGVPGTVHCKVRSISLVSPARLETCNQAAMSKQRSAEHCGPTVFARAAIVEATTHHEAHSQSFVISYL
jgi:hypothetical protein